MTDTPKAEIVAAPAFEILTDDLGRKLSYKKLSVVEQGRLMRAVGADDSKNDNFMLLANMACSIRAIDDVPYPMPSNLQQVDAAIGRVSDEGFDCLTAKFTAMAAEMQTKADEEQAAKN